MNRKGIRKFVLGVFISLMTLGMAVYAAEEEMKKNVLVETTTDTKLYEQPDVTSKELMTIEAHTTLFTVEDQNGDWILVKKDDTQGYLQVADLKLFQAEGIEQEFEGKENTYNVFMREIEYQIREKKQKIIWGITIGALVVSIFAVGIVSAVLKNEKPKKKKKKKKVKGNVDEADYTDTML